MADDINKTPTPEETAPAVAEAMADTQTAPAVDNPTPQVPTLAPEPSAPATADTAPVEMPLEAPEAPKVEPISESPNIPVNTGEIEVKEPEKPENIAIPEPEPETAPAEGNVPISVPELAPIESPALTAQIPPNEPLPITPEPVISEPVPTPAPAVPIPPTPEKPKDEPAKEEPKETTSEVIVPAHGLALKLLIKAREAIQFRRRKKLDRLMSLFLKKTQITNDDVEKLLHVSDATATRYLSILKKEGKIKQSGKTGAGVSYSRL